MHTRHIRFAAAFLATLVVAGCATTGDGTSGPSRDPGFITTAELRDIDLTSPDTYSAVQRLRPIWLRSRGSNLTGDRFLPVVYVDGSRYGELGILRTLKTTDVESLEYMDPGDATTRFGTGHPGGVIMVTTR